MINGVGSSSPTRIGQVKDDKIVPLAPTGTTSTVDAQGASPSLIAAIAEAGPPVNADKIDAIRRAIASGQYPLDVKAIAAKMIALDLPK